jgi:hypothetical protein
MLKLAPLPSHRLLAASLCAAALGPRAALALSGVCPDGSIYVVQEERQIPCKDAKAVEPHEVPPIRPEYLPSPYTWQVWNEKNSPNNPYNAIDNARQVRGLQAPAPEASAQAQAANGAADPQASERAGEIGPLPLGLTDGELRDLFQIVSLSQDAVPARISRSTADGQGVFEVALAYSPAFEARVERDGAQLDGRRVLLFTASSKRPEEFFATFTFVQGHLTFQPEHRDPRQLGVLQGRLGSLVAGEAVLGYVVLPSTFDLAAPLDVYWDDRHTTVTFGG